MEKFDLEQEIAWLQEEIEDDEFVLSSRDSSAFHRERLAENQAKLKDLLDLRKSNKAI